MAAWKHVLLCNNMRCNRWTPKTVPKQLRRCHPELQRLAEREHTETTATSAPSQAPQNTSPSAAPGVNQESRLIGRRPATACSRAASLDSGPTMNGCTMLPWCLHTLPNLKNCSCHYADSPHNPGVQLEFRDQERPLEVTVHAVRCSYCADYQWSREREKERRRRALVRPATQVTGRWRTSNEAYHSRCEIRSCIRSMLREYRGKNSMQHLAGVGATYTLWGARISAR